MEAANQPGLLSMLLPFILIFGVFYFIVILPARRQQKKKEAMIAGLKKGDRILTTGGIFGSVVGLEDQAVILKVAENTKIRVARSAVAGLVSGDQVPE